MKAGRGLRPHERAHSGEGFHAEVVMKVSRASEIKGIVAEV
jgi:hypothetical protein